jgi:hypothetical protein
MTDSYLERFDPTVKIKRLEAEVERLTHELAARTHEVHDGDGTIKILKEEIGGLRAQLADRRFPVEKFIVDGFHDVLNIYGRAGRGSKLADRMADRIKQIVDDIGKVKAAAPPAAPSYGNPMGGENIPDEEPAAPALNVSCITCVSGPRVKGKVVDSCQRYSMADQCYDHGFPAYTAAPNAPSPVVRVPVGCVREAPGNEVDGKAAAAVIPIAEALKQQDEFVKRQQQKEKDYWNRDDVCECGCVHSINGYCTDCGKAKGIAMNTFFIKTLARHEKNVATWGHQDLNTLIIATGEEFGELCKASLGNEGESHDIKKETIDLAALLVEIYEWFGGEQ